MAGKQQPATDRGMALISSGIPLRHAATMAGVSLSTLVRACKRAGVVLPRGRRPSPPLVDHVAHANQPDGVGAHLLQFAQAELDR